MKTFIGTGKGTPEAAVKQAVSGLTNPSMLLFIAPYAAMKETAVLLEAQFPGVPCIGTIGTSLVKGTVADDQLAVLGLYADAVVRCGVIENISACPVASIGELEKKVADIKPGREDTVCIEYCTGEEEKLVTTLNAYFEKKSIQLAGGTTFGTPDGKAGIVAYQGQVYEDACVYALIKNTTGRVKVFKENIYKKRTDVFHFATKVNVEKKSLIELDGSPAADVYSRELGIPKNKIIENVFENPMGRVVGDQVFISSMKELGANGELINYKRINRNDCIYFLKLGDYKEIEEQTRSEIKSQMKSVSLILSIDCIYRYLLYQNKSYFNEYAKDMASVGPHMGVVGGGEQFNNQHVNQTMVCAVFE